MATKQDASDKSKAAPADEASTQNREIFRLLVDAVRDYAIFALDSTGHVLTWNEGAHRLKGYTAAEIIGSHFSRFYLPEDLMRNHPAWELEQAIKNGAYEEEGWRLRKDGQRFWASVVITALIDLDGTIRGFAKVTRDLTQRKQAEEKLRDSEERFRLMIEGVRDYAIFMLDTRGHIATWNAGAERNKGYRAAEIIGKHFSQFYREEELRAGKPEFELREAARVGRFEDSGWRVRKDGSEFWANVVITAIRDKNDTLIGFSKVTQDLTKRKEAEDLLQAAYTDLELRVTERTAELAQAKNRAEQAVRAREDFFSIASHELRTPLTALRLRATMALRSFKKQALPEPGSDLERFKKFVVDNDEQLNRLVRLVEDMLDLARVDQGRLPIDRRSFDLAETVRAGCERAAAEFREKKVSLSVFTPPTLTVFGDRMRIEQVLTNLLTNALRYAPDSPVDVRIEETPTSVRLIVADEGPGIAPENQQRIFSRYERVEESQYAYGLGIGLYLAQQIATAHEGTMSVESSLGKGARFIFEIPKYQSII